MTICVAWIRRVGRTQELVFCSDSRLRSIGSWDANPKIFTFNRTDCAICFAGLTDYSYPLMIQLKNLVDANRKMESRFQRIDVFKQILVKTLNHLLNYKSDYEVPDVEFLFGGYCWVRSFFKIWRISYDPQAKAFVAKILTSRHRGKGAFPAFFIGDYVDKAKQLLVSELKKSQQFLDHGRIDMEPLKVMADLLSSPTLEHEHPGIGGPPQLLKVYKSQNRVPFGVMWPVAGQPQTTFCGMPLVTISGFRYPVIDPQTMKITNSNSY